MEWKEKIRHWCARSERSTGEVLTRLREWGISETLAESYVDELLRKDFINEKRFVEAYVHDHFHLHNWGPIKISAGLKEKKCTNSDIQVGLLAVSTKEIDVKLTQLILSKSISNKPRLIRYLQSRGFSLEHILNNSQLGKSA